MLLKKLLIFFFALLSLGSIKGQIHTQNPLTTVEPKYSHQYTYRGSDQYRFIDTTFDDLGGYHQFNNSYSDQFGLARLGSMGTPLNRLMPDSIRSVWNYYNFRGYDGYFLNEKNIPFYYVRSPLTEAMHWMGYDRGQVFKIQHTQNVNKNWNFMFRYKRLNDLGFYTHNRNKQATFLANTTYNNEKAGYKAQAYFISEKMEIEENGGIASDSSFRESAGSEKILLDVNLSSDSRVFRSREFFVDQRLRLAKFIKKKKEESDSLSNGDQDNSKSFLALGHSFKYLRRADLYRGNTVDSFYTNYFFSNSGEYSDTSWYRSYTNTLYVEAQVGTTNKLDLKAGVRNLITEYGGNNYQFVGNNWGLTGNLSGRLADKVDFYSEADLILTGPLAETFSIYGRGSIKLWKKMSAFGSYGLQQRFPDFFQQFYSSNNFIWQNDLKKQTTGKLKYGVNYGSNTMLAISNYSYTNYTYYDAANTPQQSPTAVRATQIELMQNFTFWDFMHWDNRLYYQTVGGNEAVLPLPDWVTRNAVYFEFDLLKKALNCIVGTEVTYFSSFNSRSYSPATGDFFVGNERVIGDYPVVDVFANFKLSKARIYIKYEHINEGISPYRFYASPRYPFPDRTLRVGITWRFFN